MRNPNGIRFSAFVFVVVALLGFTQARAQLLTASTISDLSIGDSYAAGLNLAPGLAATQTFSNISSIEMLTFRFIASDTANFAATNLGYYLGEWSGSSGQAEIDSGTILIGSSATWLDSGSGYLYFDAELDLSAVGSSLTPALSYGLTLVGDGVSNGNFVLGGAADLYTDGIAYANNGPVSSFADLSTGNGAFSTDNFSFAAFSAIPETSTVAVVMAGVFVGGLVVRRLRQKKAAVAAV